jgi:6-phosphogluconolactonase
MGNPQNKYVAYVGSYTHGSSEGIHLYDIDLTSGSMTERDVIPASNPSYLTISRNGKYLYTIEDEGVTSFEILENGDLEFINNASIRGMRGCYIDTDKNAKHLFIAGYHDGKVTVMNLRPDGSIGEVVDEIYHKGLGTVAERNFRPHVSCTQLTPDDKYLCVADIGLDNVKVYRVDHKTGRLRMVDLISCELESAPRSITFSNDGRFAYIVCEIKNYINVYSYTPTEKVPNFELIQQISTLPDKYSGSNAAAALKISPDQKNLICSNAGDNSVALFKRDEQTGLLTRLNVLPISGDYPKDIEFFPDGKHIMSLNHESGEITLFSSDFEKGLLIMNGKPLKVDTPTCVKIVKLPNN